jgi:hypothetical protein
MKCQILFLYRYRLLTLSDSGPRHPPMTLFLICHKKKGVTLHFYARVSVRPKSYQFIADNGP